MRVREWDSVRAYLCIFAWVHSGAYAVACTCQNAGIRVSYISYKRACVCEYVRVRAYLCISAWVHSGVYAVACTCQNAGIRMSYMHIDARAWVG